MKKLQWKRRILVVGLMVLGASTLFAAPGPLMLRLSDGTHTVNVTDEGANDQYTYPTYSDGVGQVMWSGALGAWTIDYSTGAGSPFNPAGTLNLSSSASTSSSGTLDIWLTQTNLTGNAKFQFDFNSDLFGSSPGATVTYAAYIGYDNTAFEQSSLIASSGSFTLPTSPSAGTSNSGSSTTGANFESKPYSLTLRTTITSASTAAYGGGVNLQSQSVPEPASVLLLVTGIAGLAWKVRKSRGQRSPLT